MSRECILVTPGNFTKSEDGLSILRERYDVILPPDFNISDEERGKVVAIVLADQSMGKKEMELFPNLKTIARTGTGYDNVDVAAAKARGIAVTRVAAMNAPAVSEYALAMILALSRNLVASNNLIVSQKRWERNQGYMLQDLTVGILGVGNVGSLLAEKLSLLGAKKLFGWDRTGIEARLEKAGKWGMEFPGLEALIRGSEVLVLAVALNPETRHLINRERLSWMKPGALIINVARGALIDEDALAEAMEKKKIGGAALDVFSDEPPLDKEFFQKLARLEQDRNIILTPHMATTVKNLFEKISVRVANNVICALDGKLEGLEIL